jgi:hypothetical protein
MASEVSGYVALAIAEQGAMSPRAVEPSDVELGADGVVRVSGGAAADAPHAEACVRDLLSALLMESSSVSGAMLRVSSRRDSAGLDGLVRELEAALIPVNRGAGRRALARLYRDTARARESGVLDAMAEPEPRLPSVVVSAEAPATAVPAVAPVASVPPPVATLDVATLDVLSPPAPHLIPEEAPRPRLDGDLLDELFAELEPEPSEWRSPSAPVLSLVADDDVDVTTCLRTVACEPYEESDVDDYVEVVFSPTPSEADPDSDAFGIPDLDLPESADPGDCTAPETVVALRELDVATGFSTAACEPMAVLTAAPPEAVDGHLLSQCAATPIAPLCRVASDAVQDVSPPAAVSGNEPSQTGTPALFYTVEDATERAPMVLEGSPAPDPVEATEGVEILETVVAEPDAQVPSVPELAAAAVCAAEPIDQAPALEVVADAGPEAPSADDAVEIELESVDPEPLEPVKTAPLPQVTETKPRRAVRSTARAARASNEEAGDADDEEIASGPQRHWYREPTPLPPLLGPAASRVVARQSSVDDLLQTFSVASVGESSELCRGLKELAGIDATGAPPAVEDCTPPPVAVEERSEPRESKVAPGRPRPLVGALALMLAVGVAGSSALPNDTVETLQARAGAVRDSALQLSQALDRQQACEAEVIVRDVPRGAEVSARGGPELRHLLASPMSKDRAVFSGLPCGEPLEVRVRRAHAKGWLSIPVTAARLSPQAATPGRVRVTLIAR